MSSSVQAFIVIGLGYGDEGKGAVVDRLTRLHGATLNVRFNGGPQAAHNVITEDGRHHTFSQFGSGTFNPGVQTHLSRFTLIEPIAILNEAHSLKQVGIDDALKRLTIEESCPIITPYHWMLNRAREISRGKNRHGSCGFGVGELRSDQIKKSCPVLTAQDLLNAYKTAKILAEIQMNKAFEIKRIQSQGKIEDDCSIAFHELYERMLATSPMEVLDAYTELVDSVKIVSERWLYHQTGNVVFEGAQGVLLDELHGFAPYNSWTDTTFHNAWELLDDMPIVPVHSIGVLRSYSTRHGVGPFVSDYPELNFPELHNGTHPWQGKFRIGHFDAVASRYALRCVGGVDELWITHLDRFQDSAQPFTWVDDYVSLKRGRIHDIDPIVDMEDMTRMQPVRRSIHMFAPLEVISRSLNVQKVYDAQTIYQKQPFTRGA